MLRMKNTFCLLVAVLLTAWFSLGAQVQRPPETTGARVRGVLVEQGTFKPVVGKQVLLCEVKYDKDGKRSVVLSPRTQRFSNDTDSRGSFFFTGVPPGSYTVCSFSNFQMRPLTTAMGEGVIDVTVKTKTDAIDLGRIVVKREN